MQGRVEVRHHGVWGTVCDDDFTNATAAVICRSLGYGGVAIAKKDGFFGPGEGPIWLDEVYCVTLAISASLLDAPASSSFQAFHFPVSLPSF